MAADPYQRWLERYNISLPHRTGRWRVRKADTFTACLPPHVLAVGGYFSEKPSQSEYGFYCRWRDSDERRHKVNALGFLRFARYRHLSDGGGETQVARVKGMCQKIRAAMSNFANGDIHAGEMNMNAAWAEYMMLVVLSQQTLVMKGVSFAPGRKKGAKSKFTLLVEEASKQAGTTQWKSVITAMESVDGIVQEVVWDAEQIWIRGDDKPRSFKRVKNILSKL